MVFSFGILVDAEERGDEKEEEEAEEDDEEGEADVEDVEVEEEEEEEEEEEGEAEAVLIGATIRVAVGVWTTELIVKAELAEVGCLKEEEAEAEEDSNSFAHVASKLDKGLKELVIGIETDTLGMIEVDILLDVYEVELIISSSFSSCTNPE